jgi:hypothetical protein
VTIPSMLGRKVSVQKAIRIKPFPGRNPPPNSPRQLLGLVWLVGTPALWAWVQVE